MNLRRWAFRAVPPLLALLGGMVVWELVVRLFAVPRYLLPPPSAVVARIAKDPLLILQHAAYTATESLSGLALAIVLGSLVAIVIAYSPRIERILYPYLVLIQVTPIVAIAPLLTIWLGFGLEPKIMVAFLIAFFPMAVNTAIGLKSPDQSSLELMRSLAASERDVIRYLRLQTALPYFFSGLRVAAPGSVVGAVVGEFVSSDKGVGFLIIRSKGTLDTELLFLAIAVSAALGLALFAVVTVVEQRLLHWHPSQRRRTA